MAKGNLFLGQARGKVGSVVFARAFGEQITRTRPTSVANPKTLAQNTQRAILATIAKEAALLTPIVDHSFANVTYGAASVRHFRKLNMGILRNLLLSSVGTNYNLSAKGAGAVPNALKISEGSLPSFSSSYQNDVVSFYQNGAMEENAEVPVSDFRVAYPYLRGGDQLTLVKLAKSSGTLVDGDATFALKVDRVVFAPNAFDDDGQMAITDEGFLNPEILDMTKTTNAQMLVAMSGGGGNGLSVTTNPDNTYAAALILSRKVNNVWQRSTQYFELSEFDDMTDNQAAIDSYGASSSLSEATEYLNQADESSPQEGIEGAYMGVVVLNQGASTGDWRVAKNTIETGTLQAAVGETWGIKINGYAPTGERVVAVEITDPAGNSIATGSKEARVDFTMAATQAGVYKCYAVFGPSLRAEFDLTVSVRS